MTPPLAPPTLEDLARHLMLGVSLFAATADLRKRPEGTRCGAARLGPDGLVRLAIPLPEGGRTLENVEATGKIALTASLPTTYRTLQVTGREARRIDWPEHEAIAAQHAASIYAEVEEVGIAPGLCPLLWSKRYAAIAFVPEAIFDQTPGPLAGVRLSP